MKLQGREGKGRKETGKGRLDWSREKEREAGLSSQLSRSTRLLSLGERERGGQPWDSRNGGNQTGLLVSILIVDILFLCNI
jgi:hypothetical protein